MKYYSQYKQDEFIYNSFFKNKRDGVFLEIGADDGVRFSNCKFFEDHLNWKGIAVEARKEAYEKLKKIGIVFVLIVYYQIKKKKLIF